MMAQEVWGEGCECWVTPESTWFRYGSAIEPGSMVEPNPDCPQHRTPYRIQRRRTKGWRMPTNARSVTRPGYYGNPYRVGDVYLVSDILPFPLPTARTWEGETSNPSLVAIRCPDSATAVEWYRQWATLALEPRTLQLLRGKNLACWCPLDQPCHADVLLELANKEGE